LRKYHEANNLGIFIGARHRITLNNGRITSRTTDIDLLKFCNFKYNEQFFWQIHSSGDLLILYHLIDHDKILNYKDYSKYIEEKRKRYFGILKKLPRSSFYRIKNKLIRKMFQIKIDYYNIYIDNLGQ